MAKDKKNGSRCDVTIRIGGEAGQGVNVISGLLGKTFLRRGLWIFIHQDVMSRIRGGHNYSQIRLCASPIKAPSSRVDILICLDRNTLDLYKDGMDGIVIYDPGKMDKEGPSGEKYLPVPLAEIAKEKGGDARMANSVASGAALAVLGLSLEPLLDLLEETFGSKGEKVVNANQECARTGYTQAKENFKEDQLCKNISGKKDISRILITGSEAIALGAIASNVRFYSAYPMSPATAIMEYLAVTAQHGEKTAEEVRRPERGDKPSISAPWPEPWISCNAAIRDWSFMTTFSFFNPSIPEGLPKLSMRIKYRGNWFDIAATPESMTIASSASELQATKVSFREKIYELKPGETLVFDLGTGK